MRLQAAPPSSPASSKEKAELAYLLLLLPRPDPLKGWRGGKKLKQRDPRSHLEEKKKFAHVLNDARFPTKDFVASFFSSFSLSSFCRVGASSSSSSFGTAGGGGEREKEETKGEVGAAAAAAAAAASPPPGFALAWQQRSPRRNPRNPRSSTETFKSFSLPQHRGFLLPRPPQWKQSPFGDLCKCAPMFCPVERPLLHTSTTGSSK